MEARRAIGVLVSILVLLILAGCSGREPVMASLDLGNLVFVYPSGWYNWEEQPPGERGSTRFAPWEGSTTVFAPCSKEELQAKGNGGEGGSWVTYSVDVLAPGPVTAEALKDWNPFSLPRLVAGLDEPLWMLSMGDDYSPRVDFGVPRRVKVAGGDAFRVDWKKGDRQGCVVLAGSEEFRVVVEAQATLAEWKQYSQVFERMLSEIKPSEPRRG